MMYIVYIMRRTQIYLTEEQGRLLEARSRSTGRGISELIRDAIDQVYRRQREPARAERARLARQTAGAWSGHSETGAQYVERVRGSGRLSRRHATR